MGTHINKNYIALFKKVGHPIEYQVCLLKLLKMDP